MLQSIILTVHLVLALFIIALVLLQKGKGAEAGTGFGAGASATVFGARGSANFLSHATAVLVTLFFITSLTLAYLAGHRAPPTSLLEQTAGGASAPAAPESTNPATPQGQTLPELPQAPAAGGLPELPQEPASTPAPQTSPAPEGPAAPAAGGDAQGGSDN